MTVVDLAAPTRRRRRQLPDGVVRGFRPDIEALRALAVVLVVLYHAGLPFLPGG
ncbi:hypothetical protein JQN72_14810, partial [Phycicoccus sp. CSK15P-2]|nr:hypothetical protein [Phycicoccus sp. CSK15P-2]